MSYYQKVKFELTQAEARTLLYAAKRTNGKFDGVQLNTLERAIEKIDEAHQQAKVQGKHEENNDPVAIAVGGNSDDGIHGEV